VAQPASRQELRDYCLRQLGAPVLEINLDDDQIDDAIDDALQYFRERHFNGAEKMYLKHEFTDDDVTRFTTANETVTTAAPDAATWENRKNYLEIPEHVFGISKVYGISSNFVRNSLFGLNNQYYLMDLFSYTSGTGLAFGGVDMVNYYMVKQHFETIDMIINTGSLVQFRFNTRQDRLYIDIDPNRVTKDQWLLIECYRALDPSTFTEVFNDLFVKKYATALMKRSWGQNLIKFNGVTLPGGVSMNGRQLYEDALGEIAALMEDSISTYELPPLDMIG
tara:strand:- start:470 stop:1306 length:837 start_codon:yes stop_codon:yes gene_type:complete